MALVDTIQSAALDAGASASAPLAKARVIKPTAAASTKSTSKAKTEVLEPRTLKTPRTNND